MSIKLISNIRRAFMLLALSLIVINETSYTDSLILPAALICMFISFILYGVLEYKNNRIWAIIHIVGSILILLMIFSTLIEKYR